MIQDTSKKEDTGKNVSTRDANQKVEDNMGELYQYFTLGR